MFDLKTRVLVVDDMSTMRKIIIKILKEIGFDEVSEAGDGAEAWEAIFHAEEPFGLIISDWNMPHSTGLDLLKRLRADQRHKATPFILVSAEAEQYQVAEAIKSGVDQYVVKPFNKEQILAKLESVYKKYHK